MAFRVILRIGANKRFANDFDLEPTDAAPITTPEERYLAANKTLLEQLKQAWDTQATPSDKWISACTTCVAELRALAEEFAAGERPADQANLETYVIRGRFEQAIRPAPEHPFPFSTSLLDRWGHEIAPGDSASKAYDVLIEVWDGAISHEQLQFKLDIDRTLTVIKVVLPVDEPMPAPKATTPPVAPSANPAPAVPSSKPQSRSRRLANWWRRRFPVGAPTPHDYETKRDDYVRQLEGIAYVGLFTNDPSHLSLAKLSLDAMRQEFVAREAGRVKNRYLRRLGKWCLVSASVSLIGYVVAREWCPDHTIVHDFRNFFLLAIGTSVGTWLSFSLRRVILQFLDLAILEEDQTDPPHRVLFMIAVTTVVGLLLATGAIGVEMGRFTANVWAHGSWALLIGLLAGMAERAMAGAVSKRAADFAGAIGGR